jgi:hypothetical protein
MATSKRKSPGESANSTRAINKNHVHKLTHLAKEVAGMVLASIIWGYIVGTAVIGMIETRVITNETVLAAVGVDDHASR